MNNIIDFKKYQRRKITSDNLKQEKIFDEFLGIIERHAVLAVLGTQKVKELNELNKGE